MSPKLPRVKRLVVKIGTSLVAHDAGHLHRPRLARLAREVAAIRRRHIDVVLVSSGAIAAGMGELGWKTRPADLAKKQAAAAVGQPRLMESYRQFFRRARLPVAQVLLTGDDFEKRKRIDNARATLSALLIAGVVPIINENDTVAVDEIRFGDNDMLAALVAVTLHADLLVLLTDVEGLMTRHPKDGAGELIPIVEKITPVIESLAQGTASENGTGGMSTKIRAAKHSLAHGVPVVIASGRRAGVLPSLTAGTPRGTFFPVP